MVHQQLLDLQAVGDLGQAQLASIEHDPGAEFDLEHGPEAPDHASGPLDRGNNKWDANSATQAAGRGADG
jgi:hypothetical protein